MTNLDKIPSGSGAYVWLTKFEYNEYGYMIPEQIVWITPAHFEYKDNKELTIYAVYYIGKDYHVEDNLSSDDYDRTWRIRIIEQGN